MKTLIACISMVFVSCASNYSGSLFSIFSKSCDRQELLSEGCSIGTHVMQTDANVFALIEGIPLAVMESMLGLEPYDETFIEVRSEGLLSLVFLDHQQEGKEWVYRKLLDSKGNLFFQLAEIDDKNVLKKWGLRRIESGQMEVRTNLAQMEELHDSYYAYLGKKIEFSSAEERLNLR